MSMNIERKAVLSIDQEQLFRALQSYGMASIDNRTAVLLVKGLTREQVKIVLNDVGCGCSERNVISKIIEFNVINR